MGYGGQLCHYDALGIQRDATKEQIRTAYKKQSVALHPDKNPHGAEFMKIVNEAYGVLSDEIKRARYDREGHRNHRINNHEGYSSSSATERRLKQQLAESEHKRATLKKKVISLQCDLAISKASLGESQVSLSEKRRQCKQLEHKQKRMENEVDYLKTGKDLLEQETQDLKRQIDVYENKMERNSRELREERRKSCDELARCEEMAKQKVEHIKQLMSEISVCYRCNGEATCKDDCTVCNGNGAIQGVWTRCHKCYGTGTFASISGEEESCNVCSSKGAREGMHSMKCFKCKGSRKGCNICYKGKIKGFNLKLCPMCEGKGDCENCCGRAYVSCQCGPSCLGHKANEIAKPATPSSLQRKLLLVNSQHERDWKADFLTRNWDSPF